MVQSRRKVLTWITIFDHMTAIMRALLLFIKSNQKPLKLSLKRIRSRIILLDIIGTIKIHQV